MTDRTVRLGVQDVRPILGALDDVSLLARKALLDTLVQVQLTPGAHEAVGESIERLMESVDESTDVDYTRSVFVAAARLDVEGLDRRLRSFVASEDVDQRRAAAYMLAETKREEALDVLVAELDESEGDLQLEAAIRLPLLDVSRYATSLRPKLDDLSGEPRFWIALALARADEADLTRLAGVLRDLQETGTDPFQLVSQFGTRFAVAEGEREALRGIVEQALAEPAIPADADLTFAMPDSSPLARAESAEHWIGDNSDVTFDMPESSRLARAESAEPPEETEVESLGPEPPQPEVAAETGSERHVNAWIGDDGTDPPKPLEVDQAARLNFQVAALRRGLSISGDTRVVDVKNELATEWVVSTRGVELTPVAGDAEVRITEGGDAKTWTARFALTIPTKGDSEVRSMMITPRADADSRVSVTVFVGTDVYRTLDVALPLDAVGDLDALGLVTEDVQHVAEAHLNLATTHEWTTPPGVLTLRVTGNGRAFALGDVVDQGQPVPVDEGFDWIAGLTKVGGLIRNVRKSAEKFRLQHQGYLDAIDAAELAARLGGHIPTDDWEQAGTQHDANHDGAWETVHKSEELRRLAWDGARLLNAFFRDDTPPRRWLESLRPGWRINISWIDDPDGVAQVPWGLMYLGPPPAPGAPVDPLRFLGLRFRLAQTTHPVGGKSRALGALDSTHRATFLYWGEGDTAAEEARWQAADFGSWNNQVLVPDATASDRRAAVVQALETPEPAPVNVIYLFCHCTVGDGNEPVLRFGSSSTLDVVDRTELGAGKLTSSPLVFANACSTSGADPFVANAFEDAFFERGCRAFLGTETKVPVVLASRFASIFFHFLYRIVDPAPMAAGEALAQSRLFLWAHYRNLGGLFYAYVNEYDLYAASNDEVAALRIR